MKVLAQNFWQIWKEMVRVLETGREASASWLQAAWAPAPVAVRVVNRQPRFRSTSTRRRLQ